MKEEETFSNMDNEPNSRLVLQAVMLPPPLSLSLILKLEAAASSETLVLIYLTTH